MAWAMPPSATGQWAAAGMGMAMTPDMNSMNMGNYTPEQWNAMQQQNWQQWAQWQQQYAQWQSQYGEKYAQQMQVMQPMSGMPPLPPGSAAAPPAPPPPDKPPPPPPPDQNNQPLFGNAPQPVSVPAPSQMNAASGYINANFTGNNQNWSQASAAATQQDANQGAVNAEALRKLAEEERLFDIQFQKWEEEIEKWKKENVNHPDKEAYKEYEAKFEACRMQLLERRNQMNQRKARLLGNTAQAANTAPTGNNVPPSATSSHVQKPVTKPSVNQNVQPQNYNNKPTPNYSNKNKNMAQMQFNESSQVSNSNNIVINTQNSYEAYQNNQQSMEDYSVSGNDFLPANANSKGIPGLDLVPESDKSTNNQDVIDITEENAHPVAPDYSKISKGINNILGDEKIMNILSMVRVQNVPGGNNAQNLPRGTDVPNTSGHTGYTGPGGPMNRGAPSAPSGQYGPNANYDMPCNNNQWGRNDNQYNNQQYGNWQNTQMNQQRPPPLMQQIVNPPMRNRMYDDSQKEVPQEQYYDANSQHGGPNMGPRSTGRPNMPPPGRPPLQEMGGNQAMTEHYRGSLDKSGVHNDRNMPMHENRMPPMNQPPPRPKWVEDPLFTPSIIVEYEHKPLRLKGREFIEPVHTFDYNHISKEDEYKKKDFEREVDELFVRKPRRMDDDFTNSMRENRFNLDRGNRFAMDRGDRLSMDRTDRFSTDRGSRFDREIQSNDFERRRTREDDLPSRAPLSDEYEDRRRPEPMYYDRRRDDRDSSRRDDRDSSRRDDYRDREDYRSREDYRDRDRYKDSRRENATSAKSRDKDTRKRGRSRESEASEHSKKSKESDTKQSSEGPKPLIMIDDILEPPGREMRPDKIVIILRGPPGSGKSYLAKLIRDKEAEYGGTARIMSIDDYFMQEGETEERDPITFKMVKKPTMKYEYDESLEETYTNSLKRAFKRSLTDGYFSFLIYDAVNDQLKSYADIWNYARQNGFQVYIITLELDAEVCFKRNIHGRSLEDVQVICSRFFPTPAHHIELDASTLLQSAAIADVTMEDASDDVIAEHHPPEVETSFTSKWERMDDVDRLARLDGTSKPLRPSQLSMEDYLQIDDWKPNQAKPGKKTVRWADIEERRQQEKMRAIGFVVGQTDWDRMTDPTMGSSALTKTKYIERVRRN